MNFFIRGYNQKNFSAVLFKSNKQQSVQWDIKFFMQRTTWLSFCRESERSKTRQPLARILWKIKGKKNNATWTRKIQNSIHIKTYARSWVSKNDDDDERNGEWMNGNRPKVQVLQLNTYVLLHAKKKQARRRLRREIYLRQGQWCGTRTWKFFNVLRFFSKLLIT